MKTSITPDAGLGNPGSAAIRELTPAETDHVSGGIVPVAVVALLIAVAAVQESCSDSEDSGEESGD